MGALRSRLCRGVRGAFRSGTLVLRFGLANDLSIDLCSDLAVFVK